MEIGTHFGFNFDDGLVGHILVQYSDIHRDFVPLDWYIFVVVMGQKFAHVIQNLCFLHFSMKDLDGFAILDCTC